LIERPLPPPAPGRSIIPAPELAEWARSTFIDRGGPLFNPDHEHLEFASILWLWAYPENVKARRVVLGDCSIPSPPMTGGTWGRAAYWQQIEAWTREMTPAVPGDPVSRPDFVIRIYAPGWLEAEHLGACALVEHELYHAGQDVDENGDPAFVASTGLPKFAIKGHDSEEFVGVVRRYGAGACADGTPGLVAAASREREIDRAAVASACGSCSGAAA